MPYKSEGGVKFTDHHIQSPLNNVANTCQVCHREETQQLITDVYQRQDKVFENRSHLEKILAKAHIEAKFAWDKGATEKQMEASLKLIRAAQWRWDFSAAGHGSSFHAPLEVSRILGAGIQKAQEARLEISRVLAKLGFNDEIPMPDISTKAKAQKYIGLDTDKLNKEKKQFVEEVIPKWKSEAKERESKYSVKNY